jgi:hypothetical protein
MLSTPAVPLLQSLMTHDEQQFFKELGARIAQLRRRPARASRPWPMRSRLPSRLMPTTRSPAPGPPSRCCPRSRSSLPSVSTSSWDCKKTGAAKREPTPLLQKQIERLNSLPKAQQKVVMQMLEGLLGQSNR